MVAVQQLPSPNQITEIWLTQLHTQYPDRCQLHLQPQLQAAIACLYRSLNSHEPTWDLRRLMVVLSPQPSFNDVVKVFMTLRVAVRQATTGYDPELVIWFNEGLDNWVMATVTNYDALRQRKSERLWQNTVQRIAELNTLSHCTAKLNASLDLASAFSAAVEMARLLSGADLCTLYQQEGDALYLRAYASEGSIPASVIPVPNPYIMEQIVIDRNRQDMPLSAVRERLGIPNVQAVCSLPLQTNDITTGKLAFIFFEENDFTLQELRVYEIFAGQVAQAVYNAQLYEQVTALTAANERWKIACEMHDTLLQTLISLNINLRVMQEQARHGHWDDVQQLIKAARELGKLAVQEGRDTLADLRDSNCGCQEQNLVDVLQLEVTAFANLAGITPEFRYDDDVYLRPNINHHLCRLVGEALTNIHRHARARHVWISLQTNRHYMLIEVRDDGIGFQVEQAVQKTSFGLMGMQERARFINAKVTVDSVPDQGTSIIIQYALDHHSMPETGHLPTDLQTFSDRQTPEV